MTYQNEPDFGDIKVVRTSSPRSATAVSEAAPAVPVSPEPLPAADVPSAGKPWLARFWWLPLLAVLAIAGAVWGRNYYESRYVGADYWAQVPYSYDITPRELLDANGEPVGDFGTDYTVTAFNEAGEQRVLEFTARGDNAAAMPQPGDFVWLSASDQLVVSQRVVPEAEVPAVVRDLIATHTGS